MSERLLVTWLDGEESGVSTRLRFRTASGNSALSSLLLRLEVGCRNRLSSFFDAAGKCSTQAVLDIESGRAKRNGFKSVELMDSFHRLRCPDLAVQEIKTHISSNGFRQKQQVRGENKCGSPWTGRLLSDVIRTHDHKMVVKAEYQRSRHGECQESQAEPSLRCP
jgi:hypothetical protein